MSERVDGGRVLAYAGASVGLAVSVWANVVHATTQPGASQGALFLAAFWPVCLFLALEILVRFEWADGWAVRVARAAVGVVAGVAAVVSYLHLHGLLVTYGEGRFPALIGPLAIDGLMAVSAAALLSKRGAVSEAPGVVEVPPAPVVEAVEPELAPKREPVPPAPVKPVVSVGVPRLSPAHQAIAALVAEDLALGRSLSANAVAKTHRVTWESGKKILAAAESLSAVNGSRRQ